MKSTASRELSEVRGRPTGREAAHAHEAEVRAAGEAIEEAALQHLGRDLGTIHLEAIATAALATVEPLIRERLAQEVEGNGHVGSHDGCDVCETVKQDARIVRGDAS